MSNAKTALTELNALRVAVGKKPLAAWKESKAKLDAAIAALKETAPAAGPAAHKANAVDAKPTKDEFFDDLEAQRDVLVKKQNAKAKVDTKTKPAKTAKSAKEPKAVKKTPGEGVSISTIAAELDIDPKVARAKLRRQDEVPCIEGSQWLFNKSDIPAIKAILTGDARKKA